MQTRMDWELGAAGIEDGAGVATRASSSMSLNDGARSQGWVRPSGPRDTEL